jgi:hypothetical protein
MENMKSKEKIALFLQGFIMVNVLWYFLAIISPMSTPRSSDIPTPHTTLYKLTRT